MTVRLLFMFAIFRLAPVAAWGLPSGENPGVITSIATAPPALRPALQAADADLAEPLREARRTLPQMRKQYQLGLRVDDALFVAVRVLAADTAFRLVQARVLGWRNGTVQALVPAAPAHTTQEPIPGEDAATPLTFPESAVLDWTLRHADGRVEGNFLGRHRETTDRAGALELR